MQYFEPAKWVAKLRAAKTDRNRLLLRTRTEAGRGGVSGRDERYKQTAFEYAFLLDLGGQEVGQRGKAQKIKKQKAKMLRRQKSVAETP